MIIFPLVFFFSHTQILSTRRNSNYVLYMFRKFRIVFLFDETSDISPMILESYSELFRLDLEEFEWTLMSFICFPTHLVAFNRTHATNGVGLPI